MLLGRDSGSTFLKKVCKAPINSSGNSLMNLTRPRVSRASGLILLLILAAPGGYCQCTSQSLQLAQQQLTKTLNYISTSQFASYSVLNTKNDYSQWNAVAATDWTSGFFPGWIWYMYEQSLNGSWLTRAEAQTAGLQGETTDASGHDIGFRIMLSYGNGYTVTRNPSYMSAIQTAAQTMSTLYKSFPDGSGTINSWPWYSSKYTTTIIDDMMTIELLFYAAQNGGNSAWYNMAVNHALKTMQNLVRSDGSTYQGVEYNSDGSVHNFFTYDGYSTNSTWARGQAWGIYGFTMAYRYTGNTAFLSTAQKLADYFISNLPPDYVPYWDFYFSAANPSYRDTSAAAIAAAGLLELNSYVGASNSNKYYNAALNIQNSLSSSAYLGNPLTTDGILLQGVDSLPTGAGIDTSLIWGDYYFIQSCYRASAPPTEVMGLAQGTASYDAVPLTWQAQSGAIRYNVKRAAVSGGPYTTIAPPPVLTTNSYTDSSVSASATYYYVVSASSAAGEGPNSAELVASTPAASAYTISGAITPAGSGNGATVTLTANGEGGSPQTVMANSSGNFSFTGVTNGSYTVTPTKTGFTFTPASQPETVNGANLTGVNFTANSTGRFSISGTISPVSSGTEVTVTLSGASTGTTTTDSSGNYTFSGLANGTYTVTPSQPGLTFSPSSLPETVNGANITSANFTGATYSVSGTISPASLGNGVTVALSGTSSATTTANASGVYTFSGLANGAYTVTPSKAGLTFSPANLRETINGASLSNVNFTVQTYSISGTITSGSGATVTLSGAASATTTTNSSGNYSFGGLVNGGYTLTPSYPGFSPPSLSETVSGANITGANFTAQAIPPGSLAIDAKVSKDAAAASTTVATAAFSTVASNELLLAFVSADYISGTNTTVTRISGAGLNWVLVLRTNVQSGTAEIWRAFAASPLTNVTVTATLSHSVVSSMTVVTFTGANTSGTNGSGAIGATKSADAKPGAPSASLVTTQNGSWVFGVGNDYDNAIARTLGAGQTLVHQDLTSTGDTYWVQMQNSPTPLSGTTVTINDSAPATDRYNLSICEILPAN